MKTIVFAVDDRKGAVAAANTLIKFFSTAKPENVILVYVEKMLGRSLIGEALESDPDLEEMKIALENSDYQQLLDNKASKIIAYFTKLLQDGGITAIKPMVRKGHPADEILAVANEEDADLIIVGSRGKRLNFLVGSVGREVANLSPIPVLIAR